MSQRTRHCDTCGERYTYERVTSKYCSKRCRYHAHLGRHNTHRMPTDVRFATLKRFDYKCQYCGASPRLDDPRYDAATVLHVDHVVPLSLGGSMTHPSNLTVACQDCNLGKAATEG